MQATRQIFADGRVHFSHGPIDLVIHAAGEPAAVRDAHAAAWTRFQVLLPELVAELPELRRPVGAETALEGPVALRMWRACHPFHASYITPMAAVAGAVAEEIIGHYARAGVDRAAVNNGGDIALHLGRGQTYRVGICADLQSATRDALAGELRPDGTVDVDSDTPVRGIATSGWQGRSFSLGIADSVTVLAATASMADAAATVIANAVDVDDARIRRRPACELKDDTDLGALPVTVDVPPLEAQMVKRALASGLARATELRAGGLICAALLSCQGRFAHLSDRGIVSRNDASAPLSDFAAAPVFPSSRGYVDDRIAPRAMSR